MIATLQEVRDFVKDCYDKAERAAKGIWDFSEATINKSARIKAMLDTFPQYRQLDVGGGKLVWATIVYTDLRNSSNRALEVGPRGTYLSMHSLLSGMAFVIGKAGGCVSNYRGDGMFGIFGLDDEGNNPGDLNEGRVAKQALRCGMAMLEMVAEVVNPLLAKNEIQGNLSIGVGIDAGQVVVTKIGLRDAHEVTPYGPPVNHAAKYCGSSHAIIVSRRVRAIYPKGKGGKVTFAPVRVQVKKSGLSGYKVKYPSTLHMLSRGE